MSISLKDWQRHHADPSIDGPTLDAELRAAFDKDQAAYDRDWRPMLQHLLEDQSERTPVLEHPLRPGWRPLALSFWYENRGLEELHASLEQRPHYIQALSFHGQGLSRAAVAKLAKEDVLTSVDQIDMTSTKIKDNIGVLVQSGLWRRLLRLEVFDCAIDDKGLAAFARGKLDRLTSLNLGLNRFSHVGLKAFLAAPFAAQLLDLDLSGNDLGAKGARLLADMDWAVERLRLPDDLDDAAVSALVASKGLRALRDLELSGDIGQKAIKAIAESRVLGALRSLSLSSSNMGAAGAKALAGSKSLGALRSLSIHASQLSDEGAQAIAGMKQELFALYLGNNGLTAAGIRALMKNEAFRSLRTLSLGYNAIEDAGASAIVDAGLAELAYLDLASCGLTAKGIQSISSSSLGRTLLDLDLGRLTGAADKADTELRKKVRSNKAQAEKEALAKSAPTKAKGAKAKAATKPKPATKK